MEGSKDGVCSRSRNTYRQVFADVQAKEGYLRQGDLEKWRDMGVGGGVGQQCSDRREGERKRRGEDSQVAGWRPA